MKIAFLLAKFPSISQTFVLNQITGLLDRGHEVDIFSGAIGEQSVLHSDVKNYRLLDRTFCYGKFGSRSIPENHFVRFGNAVRLFLNHMDHPLPLLRSMNAWKFGRDAASLSLFYKTCAFLDRNHDQYDIVHCHFGPNGILGASLMDLGIFRGSFLTTFYGYDISGYVKKYGRHVYEPLFERCEMILCLSELMRRQLLDLGCDREKIVVHHLGISTGRFVFSPRTTTADRKIRLLSIARLVEKKGLEYGIRAVAKVSSRYPGLEYHIAGDGPLMNQLRHLIDSLGSGNCVKLLGWKNQTEIVRILDDTHIFIAPSVTAEDGDQEGTPTVLMEALAQGIPVLSTLHSGIPEVVVDGKSGFLVPEKDVDALAEALVSLLDHPEKWPGMGSAGRVHVEENYDIDLLNDRLISLYKQLRDSGLQASLAKAVSSV